MGYKIGKVYRIVKIDDPTINYIGSTFTTLRQRWSHHKQNDSSCYIKKYFDEYGIDKFKIILIKEYEVYAENQKDTKQLRVYEQLWINKLRIKKCCINRQDTINYLKKEKAKEYYQDNKEKAKEYYQDNKDKIKEYQKEYRKEKVECDICKSFVRRDGLKKHQKTKKCMNLK